MKAIVKKFKIDPVLQKKVLKKADVWFYAIGKKSKYRFGFTLES